VCVCVHAGAHDVIGRHERAHLLFGLHVREKLRDTRVSYVCACVQEVRGERMSQRGKPWERGGLGTTAWRDRGGACGEKGRGAVLFARSTELHDGARVHELTRSSTKYDRVKRAASVYARVRACSFSSPRATLCERGARESELTVNEREVDANKMKWFFWRLGRTNVMFFGMWFCGAAVPPGVLTVTVLRGENRSWTLPHRHASDSHNPPVRGPQRRGQRGLDATHYM
jgi:hypothetical protein